MNNVVQDLEQIVQIKYALVDNAYHRFCTNSNGLVIMFDNAGQARKYRAHLYKEFDRLKVPRLRVFICKVRQTIEIIKFLKG